MASSHGGYTGEQLQDVTSDRNEGIQVSGERSLDEAIAKLPEDENDLGKEEAEPTPEQKKQIKAASKRIRAKFETLKAKISTEVPDQAFRYAGIEVNDSDKKWLGESIDLALEVFGVDFEVQPVGLTIKNPIFILLYPLIVVVIIIVGAMMKGKKEEDKNDAE